MGGRVVEGTGLENRQAEMLRGFESHPIRFKKGAPHWHRSVANARFLECNRSKSLGHFAPDPRVLRSRCFFAIEN